MMMTDPFGYALMLCSVLGAILDVTLLWRWCAPVPVATILGCWAGVIVGWRADAEVWRQAPRRTGGSDSGGSDSSSS